MDDPLNVSESGADFENRGKLKESILPASASLSAQDSTLSILESMTDAFFALDSAWRFTYINAQAERVLFRSRADLLGRSLWEEFPDAVGSIFEREYRRAMDEQASTAFEAYYPFPLDAWFEVRAYPSTNGLSVFFQNITKRVEQGRRDQFLVALAERAHKLTDPEEVIVDAVRSIGEFLGVARCVFGDIDLLADTCTIVADYCQSDAVASIVGTFPFSAFGSFVVAEYEAGRSVAVEDVRTDTVRVPVENVAPYEAIGIRAHITAPVVHTARLVSVIAVHSSVTRHWLPEEMELVQAAVERTWLTVEVLRQQRALAREAEDRREATERTQRVLDSITEAFFTLDRDFRFTFVNRQAEAMWNMTRAELVGRSAWEVFPDSVGGVFYHQYHRVMAEGVPASVEDFYPLLGTWLDVRAFPSEDGISVFFRDVTERKRSEEALRESEERYRRLLESSSEGIYGIDLQGRFTFVNRGAAQMLGYTQAQIIGQGGHALIHHTHSDGTLYFEGKCPIYHALHSGESIHVEDDVFWRADGTSFPVAYSAAPILEQGAVQGVVVTFADISERKILEEARERLAERERNIAQQLQAALTPEIPEKVPRMALAKYYEAALDEAGVGGDFYDVFPVDKGCTALVIGDVSGKGLTAARQVATVRNMLRYALYRAQTLVGAVKGLNTLLVEQSLLTGFATLFVGAYDGSAGTLTYVNCGQEPALVRRAAGRIEQLLPTGPVLGSFEGGLRGGDCGAWARRCRGCVHRWADRGRQVPPGDAGRRRGSRNFGAGHCPCGRRQCRRCRRAVGPEPDCRSRCSGSGRRNARRYVPPRGRRGIRVQLSDPDSSRR